MKKLLLIMLSSLFIILALKLYVDTKQVTPEAIEEAPEAIEVAPETAEEVPAPIEVAPETVDEAPKAKQELATATKIKLKIHESKLNAEEVHTIDLSSKVRNYVDSFTNQVMEIINNSNSTDIKNNDDNNNLNNSLASYFDFAYMTKYCVGTPKALKPEQLNCLTEVFTNFLIKSYNASITKYVNTYKGQTISITSIDYYQNNMQIIVNAKLKDTNTKDGSRDKKVTLIIRNANDQLKFVDITFAGISILKVYKESFASKLKQKDGFCVLLKSLIKDTSSQCMYNLCSNE